MTAPERGAGPTGLATIEWLRDPDEGLARARATGKPVLLAFSAAPM